MGDGEGDNPLIDLGGAQAGEVRVGDVAGGGLHKPALGAGGVYVAGDATVYAGGAPAAAVAPRQLRAPVADFVGREREIAALVAALEGGGAAAIGGAAGVGGVSGMGGVGKTELAMVVGARVREHFPDGQIVLGLQGSRDAPLAPEEAQRRVIRAFHPEARLPDDPGEVAGLYRSVLAGRSVLILADDARDAAQARPLLPPPGSALLVTTRQRFVLPGMARLDLGRLMAGEAVALLRAICARLGTGEAARLAEACGRLPLALRVAGGLLASDETIGVAGYLARLADERRRLAALREPGDPDLDVEASLGLSYAALDEGARGDLAALGVFAASFDGEAAGAVLEEGDEAALEARLGALYRRSLVEFVPEGHRYDLHELVRAFALARLGEDEREARLRHARYYLGLARTAESHYIAGGKRMVEGLALFDRERPNLDAARRWLQGQAGDRACDELLVEDANVTNYTGRLRYDIRRERIPQLEAALVAARRLWRSESELWFIGYLGSAYGALGEHERVVEHYKQVLAIARKFGNRRHEGHALGDLGMAYNELGKYQQAQEYCQQHLAIVRELGDRRSEGQALGKLGIVYHSLGEHLRALEHYQQSLAIVRETGDRYSEGRALGNLGAAYSDMGEHQRALEHHQQNLAIALEIGDRQSEANASWNIGSVLVEQGETARALPYLEAGLAFYEEIGHPQAEVMARGVAEVRHDIQGGGADHE